MILRKVTNVDPKRGRKKSIWFEDTAHEEVEYRYHWDQVPQNGEIPEGGQIVVHPDGRQMVRTIVATLPSRYGPLREYVANCTSIEIANQLVSAWNRNVSEQIRWDCCCGRLHMHRGVNFGPADPCQNCKIHGTEHLSI